MKLYDGKLELKALRTICEAPAKIKYMTFAQLNESHFYSEAAKESFARISKLAKKNAEIPEYESIIHDPVVSETTRAVLKKIKSVTISDKGVAKLVGTLDKYRKARELYYLSESINNSLVEEKVDIDNLIDFATEKLSRARSASNRSQEMFHSGAGNNTSQLVKKMLNKEEPDLVPTGFNAFDQRNGGIAYGSLFTLAGKTGSGKTSLALQLSRNMADIGREDVFYVPLEMDEQECFERVLSNLSGTPLEFIKKAKLTERQKNKIWKAYKSWVKSLKRDKTRWSIFSPYDGITLDDALFTIQPFKPRVVVIDYLTLLKLPGKKDQWQELSEAAWLGKTWAKKTHGICIMLAQLGDDDKIRYSKAVAEHSNNSWTFGATKESRENKIMEISQIKARNQYLFDFTLGYTDDTYRVFDIDQNFTDASESKSKEKSSYMDNADD